MSLNPDDIFKNFRLTTRHIVLTLQLVLLSHPRDLLHHPMRSKTKQTEIKHNTQTCKMTNKSKAVCTIQEKKHLQTSILCIQF